MFSRDSSGAQSDVFCKEIVGRGMYVCLSVPRVNKITRCFTVCICTIKSS